MEWKHCSGEDGKLFVVKLISLLSPQPPSCPPVQPSLSSPHKPPATSQHGTDGEWRGVTGSDSHTDQIREMPSDNTTLRLGIPLTRQCPVWDVRWRPLAGSPMPGRAGWHQHLTRVLLSPPRQQNTKKSPNMEESKVIQLQAEIELHLGQSRTGECRSGQEEQWRYTILIMIFNLIFDRGWLATWEQVALPADNKVIKQ